jgi:hypothetical protein
MKPPASASLSQRVPLLASLREIIIDFKGARNIGMNQFSAIKSCVHTKYTNAGHDDCLIALLGTLCLTHALSHCN